MILEFVEKMAQKNEMLNSLEISLMKINKMINECILNFPELRNYSDFPQSNNKYIYMDYPNIVVSFPPYKKLISCDELLVRLSGKYLEEEIMKQISNYII